MFRLFDAGTAVRAVLILILLSVTAYAGGPALRITIRDLTGHGLESAAVKERLAGYIDKQAGHWAADIPAFIDITVTAEPDEHLDGAVPDWGAGFAQPARNRVVVVNDPRQNKPRFGLEETMRHEVIHILFHHTAGGRPVPRWFEEGFAMTAAGEWRFGYGFAIARARLTGSLLGLEEIDRVLGFPDARAQLAYAQSFDAFKLLVRLAGPEAVYAIPRRTREDGFAAAFVRAAGMTEKEFHALCRTYFKRQYGPFRLLVDGSLYWLGITALFLAAYVFTRIRTRKKLHEWDEQEHMIHAYSE